jgi:hypothetical protein
MGKYRTHYPKMGYINDVYNLNEMYVHIFYDHTLIKV